MKKFKRGALAAALSGLLAAGWLPAVDAAKNPNAPDSLVKARQLFFGLENVDPDSGAVDNQKVVFSWLSNTTYAVAAKGRVFLLDSFVTRLEGVPGRTPFVLQDMVDLQPEAILLGHGHGDHADNASGFAKEDRPEIRWLVDPNDYLRPLVFDPKDERWAGDGGRPQQDGLCK